MEQIERLVVHWENYLLSQGDPKHRQIPAAATHGKLNVKNVKEHVSCN